MTTQGDPRSIPAGAAPARDHDPAGDLGRDQDPDHEGDPGRDQGYQRDFDLGFDQDLDQGRDPSRSHHQGRAGARSGGRRVLAWCAAVLVLGAGIWVASRPDPGDWLPGFGPSSKDATLPPVVGNPPPTSSTDPNPFTAERLFPPARQIDQADYKAKRSGVRQGSDCTEMLQESAKTVLHDTGCQGYLTVSFSRLDGKVLTSVTILRFADDGTGQKVAGLLQQQPGALQFVLPDGTIAAPSPAAGGKNASAPRVEAVHHYVTVTSSRAADGVGQAVPPAELDVATRAVSYTAGAAFIWP